MRNGLTKLLVLILSVSLVSCSQNSQNENTTVGAVSGGVLGGLAGSAVGAGTGRAVAIGVGVVGGALLGGWIGHSMDSTDRTQMNNSMDNPTNQATTWKNPNTGKKYSSAPTSEVITYNGNPNCRRYTTMITDKSGESKQMYGVACRRDDGNWVSVKS